MVPVIKLAGGGVLINGTRKNIAFGTPLNNLSVGSSVYMNVSGTRTEFIVVNHGNPDASLYDASCDGTWLLMKNVYECRPFNDSGSSRNNIYPRSPIHTYLNGNFLAKFDTGIQGIIKQVKIPYTKCAYGGTSEIMSLSNGVSAKIFLLGAKELGFTRDDMPKDGSKLSYFEAGFTDSANGKRIAYLNGESRNYFTRTPRPDTDGDGSTLWQVFDGGTCSLIGTDSTVLGIRPALVLPSNVKVDANMNIIV